MVVATPVKSLLSGVLMMCLLLSLSTGDVLTVGEEFVDIVEGELVGRGSDGEVYTIYATSRSSKERKMLYCKVVSASDEIEVSYFRKAIPYGEPWQLKLQQVLVEGTWVKTLGAAYQQLAPDRAVMQLFMEGGGRTMAGIVGARSNDVGAIAAGVAREGVQQQQPGQPAGEAGKASSSS
jgi:hypothetical protein